MAKYTPPTSFVDVALAEVAAFVEARPLCTIVAVSAAGLISAHVPVLLKRDGAGAWLEGHVARGNEAFARLSAPITALAMFQREQEYGLPEAARSAVDDARFGAVHLQGRLQTIDDHAYQFANIEALSASHVAGLIHPWAAPDLPKAFTEVLAGKTIGLRFVIERAQASHAYAARGTGRTDGVVDIDPREFNSPNCRPSTGT
jgi:transcriptional regulator